MIEIKTIQIPMVDAYSPTDDYLGTLNEYEFLDMRVQIKKAQATGYYLRYKGKRINIDRNGSLEDWPEGLFDQITDLLIELL